MLIRIKLLFLVGGFFYQLVFNFCDRIWEKFLTNVRTVEDYLYEVSIKIKRFQQNWKTKSSVFPSPGQLEAMQCSLQVLLFDIVSPLLAKLQSWSGCFPILATFSGNKEPKRLFPLYKSSIQAWNGVVRPAIGGLVSCDDISTNDGPDF